MKWIGQHIWDFISRFRNDVYLDNVQSGSVNSGDHLGVDSTGKIVKTTGGSGGGGSITVKDDDNNTFSNITEIAHYGNDQNVRVYANGTGKVIVDHHASLNFAPAFPHGITDSVANYNPYYIGDPQTGNDGTYGYNFHAGNWGGTASNKATNASSITFTSSVVGNFLINGQASKIKVSIFGPNANSSSDSNLLTSHVLQVTADTTSPHSQANGITIQISNFGQDETPDKRKASVTVTVDLDNSAIIDTSGDYTGSQKYSKIKIEQLDNNDAAITGVTAFESAAFFYDHLHLAPTAASPTFTFGTNTVKLLSNIGYYDSATWTSASANHSNLTRDTGVANGPGVITLYFNSGLGLASYGNALSGDSGDTNDHTNSHSSNISLPSLNTPVVYHQQGVSLKVLGGLGGDSSTTSYVYDFYRNYNNVNSSATSLFEDHKGETYRISDDIIAPSTGLITLSTAQTDTESVWKQKCVGHDPTGASTSPSVGLDNTTKVNQHLVQGYFNGGWKLHHPSDIPTLALLPTATDVGLTNIWNHSSLSGTFKYYRFFKKANNNSTATGSWSINIAGLPRGADGATSGNNFINHAVTNSNIEINFLNPGPQSTSAMKAGVYNNGVWIPLSVAYNSGNNLGCWFNSNTAYQTASSTQYDLSFNSTTVILLMEIKINSAFPASLIGNITVQPNHVN